MNTAVASEKECAVDVRYALPEELSQVHALMGAFAHEIGFTFSLTLENLVAAVDADRSRVQIVVGLVDGCVAGYAIVCVVNALWTVRMRPVLDDLYVASRHRGRGIGSALLRFLVGEHGANDLEMVSMTPVDVPVHPVFRPYLGRAVICRHLTFSPGLNEG
jgi:GNAT superfamily N-acetyltransferase